MVMSLLILTILSLLSWRLSSSLEIPPNMFWGQVRGERWEVRGERRWQEVAVTGDR